MQDRSQGPDVTSGKTDRRELLLDAAIDITAAQGLRGVTHRAIQQAAGLPHGSVTYYFKTRQQLVTAMVERLVERDRVPVTAMVHDLLMTLVGSAETPDYEHLAERLRSWLDEGRVVHLARMELDLEGVRDPELMALMSRGAAEFWKIGELIAAARGSKDPELDGRVMVTLLLGLFTDYFTREPHDPRVLLAGMRRAVESVSL
jgi:AcrR family transcriptional regulator